MNERTRLSNYWMEIEPVVKSLADEDSWDFFIESCTDWINDIAPQLSKEDKDELLSLCIIAYQTGEEILKRKIQEVL